MIELGVNIDHIATVRQARQTTEPSEIKIDAEKANKWIANGAQPTETVKVLLKKCGIN